jgi:hypothetical protein
LGVLWTDNDWRDRLKRLAVKLGASPVLPVLAWSKVVESVVASGPLVAWSVAAVLASFWFVVAEDFVEYLSGVDQTIQEYLDG